jgi:pyrroline-5-carboxylate reductase
MLKNLKMAFIGSGIMGETMISGLIDQKLVEPPHLIASDIRQERGEELTSLYGIQHTTVNADAVRDADIVILAVKPQNIDEVMAQIRGHLPTQALVISIVAGVPLQRLSQGLEHHLIVRVMPNTPARVGQGISAWTATEAIDEKHRQQAVAVLQAFGEEIYMDHEYYLDMATALSGSGPAYVFLFIEALVDAGVHMGFSRRVAEEMVLQTVEGSVAFAREYPEHPAQLRNMVTSPGGTTADALYQLEKGGFRTILSKAIFAAYQKSKTLGENA